ncbi:MAG: hypothetical protein QM656_04110, partial [Paracoccaceae bacterium]
MQDRILVIGCDRETAEGISAVVAELGCQPIVMRRLQDGLSAINLADFQVIVLGRTLPEADEATAIGRLRAAAPGALVLLLAEGGPA